MLRHKKTVTSLYRLGNKLSVCDAKQFHLTNCVLLRKVGPIKKVLPESDSFTKTVASGFHLEPNTNTNNFYGIESDEGVIDIEQRTQNIKLEQDLFINRFNDKLNQEKFKKVRFGTVRLDRENKPKIHGHFESTEDTNSAFEMDVKTKNFEIDDKVTDPLYSNTSIPNTSVTQIQSKHIPSIDSNVTNNIPQIPIESREFETTQNADNTNRLSFIDDLYFTSEILYEETKEKQVLTQSLEVSNYSDHQMTQNTYSTTNEDNFFDELYFSNEIADTKNNYNCIENLSKASSCQEMKSKNLEDNGLDELHFQNQAVQITKDDYSNLKLSTASIKEKGYSFIDESYFDNSLINDNIDSQKDVKEKADFHASNVKNFPKASNPKENFDFSDEVNNAENGQKYIKYSTKDQLSYSENDQEYKNISNSDANLAHGNQNSKFDSYSSADYRDHNIPLNSTDNLILQSSNASHRSNDPSSSKHNNERKVEGSMNDLLKANLSGNIMKRDHEIIEKNQRYTHDKSDKVIQETKRDDVKSSDEIETAHDFVNKLRAEKKQFRPLIKGGKIMPTEEKKDSKGFRILSNQVPQLSYFTRDEILMVLRNNVLYSDDDIVVLNKPYNLVMHESKTSKDPCLSQYLDELASQLDSQNKSPKLITVHRLDKETCGCLLLARNEISAQRLQSLFAQRKILKTYWIVTIAVPDLLEGVIDIPIAEGKVDKRSRMVLHPKIPSDIPYENHSKHGKRAVSHYKVISTSGNAALVEVQPETGIKHQIRVHFGFGLSCPILGDHKYSHLTKMVPQKLPSDLLQRLLIRQSKVRHVPMHIYARSITIPQYREGRNLFVMAPMPTHISVNLQRLKFRKK